MVCVFTFLTQPYFQSASFFRSYAGHSHNLAPFRRDLKSLFVYHHGKHVSVLFMLHRFDDYKVNTRNKKEVRQTELLPLRLRAKTKKCLALRGVTSKIKYNRTKIKNKAK